MSSIPSKDRDAATTTRVGMISLGCAKNLVDTEVMLGHLDRAGCEFVTDPADADVVIVNTCGFIDSARKESVQAILEATELKRDGKLRRVVVAGCMVQRYQDELRRELPDVDAFIDLDQLGDIVAGVGVTTRPVLPSNRGDHSLPILARRAGVVHDVAPSSVAAWSASSYLYDDDTPRRIATPPWTAYVKIAEGCEHSCAFCAIPAFRGAFRSRRPESVRREAENLARAGVREINLIAQDSSRFGLDLGITDGLAKLLANLSEVDDLRWIRVHYLYPNTVTEGLVDAMGALPRVVNYVDMPLQHAHRDTLRRMRRGGTAESHLKLLNRFRSRMSDVVLRSTFIVGFPGETDEEFETLLEFVREARFNHLGAFTYSHEERTPARSVEDDVAEELKQERHARLLACQQTIAFERAREDIGREMLVLVEGAHPETEHLLVGRTYGQAPDVDGQVLINDGHAEPGTFVKVAITDAAGYDSVGRVIGPA